MKNKIIDRTFPVNGMSCAVCSNMVETILNEAKGVVSAKVNFANNTVLIQYDSEITNPQILGELLRKADFELVVVDQDANLVSDENAIKKAGDFKFRFLISLIFTLPVFILSMFVMIHTPWMNYLLLGLSMPVVLWSGNKFFIGAWHQLKQWRANMDTLVALSSGIAFLYSVFVVFFDHVLLNYHLPTHTWFESATVIITFVLLGKYLEEKSKRKASETIRRLIRLQPRNVLVQRGGAEMEIDVDQVAIGDLVIVKAGQIVPIDGLVDSGDSYVDESSITGEAVPVHKTGGSRIFAGTLNQNGLLYLKATQIGSQTLIAKIIRMVEEAQSSKAPIQKLVDKIAMVFVPVILIVAFLTFLTWFFFGPEGQNMSMALVNAITVLVIACPCALGLATPTALIVGVGRGAELGILIRDAEALEQAYKIDIVVFDKTGTLTKGMPQVVDSLISNSPNMIDHIYSIESKSDHPYAKAITSFLELKKTRLFDVEDYLNIRGIGIQARIGGVDYKVVSAKHVLDMHSDITPEFRDKLEVFNQQGALTVIMVLAENKVLALFGIRDEIREDSVAAIRALKKMGIHPVLSSGDNEKVVADIAAKCGIDEYYSSVMPDRKGEIIQKLQSGKKIVAMVGDGINDSHALATADVGIAMGSGSDIAIEAASITLTNSSLSSVPAAIKLSRNTLKIIRQNLFWAFFYNLIAVPVAAGILYPINGVLLNPMIAGAAMAMSSVSVVLNSLRLKKMYISNK